MFQILKPLPLLVRVWISRVETIEMGSTAFLPAHARVWISRFSRFAATSRSFSSRTCVYRYRDAVASGKCDVVFLLAHARVWIWLKRWRFHIIIYISQRTRNARIVYPSHSVNPNSTKCSSRTRAYGFIQQPTIFSTR